MSYLSIKKMKPEYIHLIPHTEKMMYHTPTCHLQGIMIHLQDVTLSKSYNGYMITVHSRENLRTLRDIYTHLCNHYSYTHPFIQDACISFPSNMKTDVYFESRIREKATSADVILKYLKTHDKGNRVILHVGPTTI